MRLNATSTSPDTFEVAVDDVNVQLKTFLPAQQWVISFDDGSNNTGVLALYPAPGGGSTLGELPATGLKCAFDFSLLHEGGVSSSMGSPDSVPCALGVHAVTRVTAEGSVAYISLAVHDPATGAVTVAVTATRRPRKDSGGGFFSQWSHLIGFGALFVVQVSPAPADRRQQPLVTRAGRLRV